MCGQATDQSKYFRQSDESQTADKGISTVKITQSFRPPFWGGGADEGAEPSSPPAGGEIPIL